MRNLILLNIFSVLWLSLASSASAKDATLVCTNVEEYGFQSGKTVNHSDFTLSIDETAKTVDGNRAAFSPAFISIRDDDEFFMRRIKINRATGEYVRESTRLSTERLAFRKTAKCEPLGNTKF